MGQTSSATPPGFYSQLSMDIAIWLFLSLIAAFLLLAIANHYGWLSSKKEELLVNKLIQPKGRSFLYTALGSLWIFDGLLQAQPAIASSFPSQILAPLTSSSQPELLNIILRWEIYGWQVHPITIDIATALIQIGLGVTILVGKNTIVGKIGLWSSIIWSLIVWVGGEALGGILAPGASEISGWPGAVLFYAIGAVLLLLPYSVWNSGKVAKAIRYCLGITLVLGAILQGLWKPQQLSSMFSAMATAPQPSFLSTPIATVAQWTASHPIVWNEGLTAIMALLGIGLLSGRATKKWSLATAVWLLATWWIGQDFGGILSGTGTDPNLSFPLLLLLLTERLLQTPSLVSARMGNNQKIRSYSSWRHLWPLAGGLAGLVAITVGSIPTLVLMPSWIVQPIALHITPPPPRDGLAIPLATMTAELNVDMLASKGRLQVSLQAPHSGITHSPSTVFRLSGQLQNPAKSVKTLKWLSCGQGCFVTDVNWRTGMSHLSLQAKASGWKGGNANFNIPWPPHPNTTLLPKVVKAMRKVKSFNLTQIDTSDTNFGSFTATNRLSGSQILHDEPFHLVSSGVVILSHSPTSTQIAFGNISQGTFVRLWIGKNNRIIREQLVQPQQLTLGIFHYGG